MCPRLRGGESGPTSSWWKHRLLSLLCAANVLCLASAVAAQSGWQVEFGLTLPYNLPAPLRITQNAQPDLDFSARYSTAPFEPPVTWQLRVGRWSQEHAWELELIHHKVYLENGPPEVERFSISHGFNLLTLQHAWRRERWQWRLGAGLVLAHAESTVRGKKLEESGGMFGTGYSIAGPTASIAAARPVALTRGVFLKLEGKLALSYASVPVADGGAHAYNVIVQLAVLCGAGPDGVHVR